MTEDETGRIKFMGRKKQNRPEIGTKMYSVHEHRYHAAGCTGPVLLEYCVCEAEVRGFCTGSYTEIKLVGISPDGYITPYFYRLSDINKEFFYSPAEAALLAKAMSEKCEKAWGWIGTPHLPMRRSWEPYLIGNC